MPTAAELREQLMRRANAAGAPTGSPSLHISSKGPVSDDTHMTQLDPGLDPSFDSDLDLINSMIPPAHPTTPQPSPQQPVSTPVQTAPQAEPNPFASQPQQSASVNPFAQNPQPATGMAQPQPTQSADPLDGFFDQNSESDQESTTDADDMKSKLIIGGVIGVIILVLIVMFIGQKTKAKQTTPDASQGSSGSINIVQGSILSGSNPILNENLSFSEDVYTDSIQISKFMTLEDNAVHCYFKGTLTNYGKAVVFEVSAEDYNKYANNSVIDVAYHIARFDGVTYCLNFEIQG